MEPPDCERRLAMPTFMYNALTSVGNSVNGELVAEHERAALRELKRRGLIPYRWRSRPRQDAVA